MVLSEFSRHTRHVRRFPCEDVPILKDEFDERAFLFGVAQTFASRHRVNNLVDARKSERIFWTSSIEVHVINAHTESTILF